MRHNGDLRSRRPLVTTAVPNMCKDLPCRHPILVGLGLLCLVLTGCNGSSSNANYPKTWPPLASAKSADNCSDLQGNYRFDAAQPAPGEMTFGVASTFLAAGLSTAHDKAPQTFTITGNADTGLTITFSAGAISTAAGPGNPWQQQTIAAQRADAFTCDGGWFVGAFKQDLLVTYAKPDHHGGAIQNLRRSSLGPQTVRLRRDAEGGLVARSVVRLPRVLSLWAETGVGIPYWIDYETIWARWEPTAQQAAGTRPEHANVNAAAIARHARQEHELEGSGGADKR